MSKNVYQLISTVSAELSAEGISKDRTNAQQGYKFRGIDDVLNALAPIISSHGLVILPRILSREMIERQSAKGTMIFSVIVDAEFDFVSSHDGSKHTVKMFGEAMDSADKATNKAMSAAYKYAAFQTFCIPTEGDNDADAVTHTIASKKQDTSPQKKELKPNMVMPWTNAKAAYVRDGNLNAVLARFEMSEENQDILISECTDKDIPQ